MTILNPADQEAAGHALLPLIRHGMASGEVQDALPASELVTWIFGQLLLIATLPLCQAEKELRVRILIVPALKGA